jgi:DGQHR domain-containing protein
MAKRSTAIPAIKTKQRKRTFHMLKLRAKDLVAISYVARRGETDEAGAVQRVLNARRISQIKDYAIHVGDFPNCIVLILPIAKQSAQIIDGQHRVAGLDEAIRESAEVGNIEIPVALYTYLGTRECADLFLSINTEQKPVPRSLVFDLYGLASEALTDHAAVRARDIAERLNELASSPYQGMIKFPKSQRRKGGIALSTVVQSLKPLLIDKGIFEQAKLSSLEEQYQIVENYFNAIKKATAAAWDDRDNAYIYAAGFSGAVDFFRGHLFDFCVRKGSFQVATIYKAFDTAAVYVSQADLRGLGGAKARQLVNGTLVEAFDPGELGGVKFKM